MAHVIELAKSGRARCRGCGKTLPTGAPRLGERLPNPYSDAGDMTLWFHLQCAAYKRPQVLLEVLLEVLPRVLLDTPGTPDSSGGTVAIDDATADALRADAALGLEHRRLPRLDGAARAPSGRAKCRQCEAKIDKDTVRVSIVFYEDGRFDPGGHVHAACASEYFGTADLIERVKCFSAELDDATLAELAAALGA